MKELDIIKWKCIEDMHRVCYIAIPDPAEFKREFLGRTQDQHFSLSYLSILRDDREKLEFSFGKEAIDEIFLPEAVHQDMEEVRKRMKELFIAAYKRDRQRKKIRRELNK